MKLLRKVRRKSVILIAVLLGLCYCGGYGVVRRAGFLVHYSGYVTNSSGVAEVANHRIAGGDYPGDMLVPLMEDLFTPLRWGEAMTWYLVRPTGTPF